MLVILIELYVFIKLISNAVYSYTRITGLPEAVKELAELTLLVSYNGRVNNGSSTFGIYL